MLPKRSKPLVRPAYKSRSEEGEQGNAPRAPNAAVPVGAWGGCLTQDNLRDRLSL